MRNLLLPILCFFLLSFASAQARMTVIVVGGGSAAAAPSPDWCVDWDAPCDDIECNAEGSGCGGDFFTNTNDVDGNLTLNASKLRHTYDTVTIAEVWEDTGDVEPEITAKFKVTFSTVTGLNAWVAQQVLELEDQFCSNLSIVRFGTKAAEEIVEIYVALYRDGGTDNIAGAISPAAATEYEVIFYRKHATGPGANNGIAAIYFNGALIDSDATIDDDEKTGFGCVSFGLVGAGGFDQTEGLIIDYDDLEIYFSDQRP